MAKDFFSEDTFEEMLKVAKQKPVLFAFAKGKNVDGSVFGLKRIQGGGADEDEEDEAESEEDPAAGDLDPETKRVIAKGKKLALLAKKEPGAGTKTAYGEATVTGQLMTLNCFEYVQGMKKSLNAKFKKSKKFSSIKFQILVQPGTEGVDPDDVAPEDGAQSASPASESTKAPEEPAATEAAEAPNPLKQQLTQALGKLTPAIKAAAAANPSRKAELVQPIGQIKRDIDEGNFNEAKTALLQLGKLVKEISASGASAPASDGAAQKLKAALGKVVPAIKSALAANPDAREELQGLVQQIRLQMDAGQFDEAKNTLMSAAARVKELSASAQQRPPEPDANEDPVWRDWRIAREQWEQAIETVGRQLEALGVAFTKAFGTNLDPETTAAVEELLRIREMGLPALTGHFKTPVMAAILDVEKAPPDKRPQLAAQGAQRVSAFLEHVLTDTAVAAVDTNEFGVTVTMRATLEPALIALRNSFEAFTAEPSLAK